MIVVYDYCVYIVNAFVLYMTIVIVIKSIIYLAERLFQNRNTVFSSLKRMATELQALGFAYYDGEIHYTNDEEINHVGN